MNPTSQVSLVSKAGKREIRYFFSTTFWAMSLCPCAVVQSSVRNRDSLQHASVCHGDFVWVSPGTQCCPTHTDVHPERYEEVGAPIQALKWCKMGVAFLPRVSLYFTGDPLRARVTVLCEQKGRWIILWICLYPEHLMSRDFYCTCPIWGPLPLHCSTFTFPLL